MRSVVRGQLHNSGVEISQQCLQVRKPSTDTFSDRLSCVTSKVDFLIGYLQQQLQSLWRQILNFVNHQKVHFQVRVIARSF